MSHQKIKSEKKDKPDEQKKKERAKQLKEAFTFFNSISIDMSNYKFNREEANRR